MHWQEGSTKEGLSSDFVARKIEGEPGTSCAREQGGARRVVSGGWGRVLKR